MSHLPAEWVEATLGEVAKWGSGGTPTSSNPAYYGGDIPWAVIGDLTDGWVEVTAKCITGRGLDESSAKLVEPGTLLVAMYGSIGRLGIARIPMATNQAIATAVPNTGVIDPKYLFWYLRSQRRRLATAGKGATQDNIGQAVLKAWPVTLAPLAEQRRIVEAIEEQLSRLDAAEDSVKLSRRNLRRFRAAALADSFAGNFTARLLGEVARTQLGKMLSKKAHRGGPGGRPYLRNKNVQWGRFDLSDVATMDFSEVEAEKFRLQEGDVLVCEGGEVGRAAVWRGELGDCYFQKAVHRVRPSAELLPDFLAYYLRRLSDTDGFERYVTGSTIDHLPQEDLRRMPIPVPDREQQEHIVALVEQSLSVAEVIEAALHVSIQRSAGLRQAILREAFEGRLVPQNPSAGLGSDLR